MECRSIKNAWVRVDYDDSSVKIIEVINKYGE